ncbi:hypothetical protein [Tabrizicola sp.]|uniref:hypothetical protein n=1 Tax=Tabrizicola sp. TaxID=2005166 RepID=UPI00286B92F3|nr:hypothetical protein [Tabrizicola sp.]
MSNPESFIDEVTEEVRRDRLFRVFRKYGWIGIVLVLGVVGGAAWNEWSKSRNEAQAEAFGDAVTDALDLGSSKERRDALAAVPTSGDQAALLQLILASDPEEDKASTLAALEAVAADATLPVSYRDLAVLRRVLVGGADIPLADRRTALDSIAVAGRPYRPLAEEQLAYLLIEEKKPQDAIALLSGLVQDQEASGALRARAGQVITALGGVPPETAGG